MMEKTQIVDALGEKALVLPALLQSALMANERAKYLLSVLQMAVSHADRTEMPVPSLRSERIACGIADVGLDRAIARSRSDGTGYYVIPGVRDLMGLFDRAMRDMLAPLEAAAALWPDRKATFERSRDRLDRLIRARPPIEQDAISGDTIAGMTCGVPADGDGFHLLVMDLHKEIDRLVAAVATEQVAGAKAYGIVADDRPLIAAFMQGLARTAPLKFDHPGLDTIAVRQDGPLLIQNDIGATEAHVLVIRIGGLRVDIIYTDVHAQRVRFFQSLFQDTGVSWDEWRTVRAQIAEVDYFYMARGTLVAGDAAALAGFLERAGSRIVFLIDWNKARKSLGLMVPNENAVAILTWAAANDFGHRAFLELGGERLVYSALERAAKAPLRYGEPLHEIMGVEPATEYLRYVLQTAASGLLQHRSESLIRDEIRADLFTHFRTAESRLLDEAARHARLIAELAVSFRDAMRHGIGPDGEPLIRAAAQAKHAETEADEIVRATRETVRHIANGAFFARLLETADDAIDNLEEAAFLGGLFPGRADANDLPPPLLDLTDMLAEAADVYRATIEAGQKVHRGGARADTQRFLEAIDRLMTLEHRSDDCERAVTVALLDGTAAPRCLQLMRDVAGHLEAAADALLHASLILRDHILNEVMQA